MTQYLKYRMVDVDSGAFLGAGVMGKNGLRHPFITGLDVKLRDSNDFIYATAPDGSLIPGVGSIETITLGDLTSAYPTEYALFKTKMKQRLWSASGNIRLAATAEYTAVELIAGATFKIVEAQLADAAANDAAANIAAPLLATEATARGITTKALATKVIANYNALSTLEASVAGYTGMLADVIDSVTYTTDYQTSVAALVAAIKAADSQNWLGM